MDMKQRIFCSLMIALLFLPTAFANTACETPTNTTQIIADIDTYISGAYDRLRDDNGILCGDKNRIKLFGVDYYPDVNDDNNVDVGTNYGLISGQIAEEMSISFDASLGLREFLLSLPSSTRSDMLVSDVAVFKKRLDAFHDLLRRSQYSCGGDMFGELRIHYYAYRQMYLWLTYADEAIIPEDQRVIQQGDLSSEELVRAEALLKELYNVLYPNTEEPLYNPFFSQLYTAQGGSGCSIDPAEVKVRAAVDRLFGSIEDVGQEGQALVDTTIATTALLSDKLFHPVETLQQAVKTRGTSLRSLQFAFDTNYALFQPSTETSTGGEEYVRQREQARDMGGVPTLSTGTDGGVFGQYNASLQLREELEARKDNAIKSYYTAQQQAYAGTQVGNVVISKLFDQLHALLTDEVIAHLEKARYDIQRICQTNNQGQDAACGQ